MLSDVEVSGAIQQVTDGLAPRAVAILLRHPAVDIRCPDTSDLDFVVLADIPDMRSERLQLPAPGDAPVIMADITWLPWGWVKDAPNRELRRPRHPGGFSLRRRNFIAVPLRS